MKSKDSFYITTAIDYPSAAPHLGHLYEKTTADVLARWHRNLGEDVFFSTGTDEHGIKIQRKAEKAKLTPKEFVDKNTELFKKLCRIYNISYDRFIRTTDKDHEDIVKKLIKKMHEKGDIYLGNYEGLYCTECENYYLEKDLNRGNCPVHDIPPELFKEESYFFKMSKYREKLLDVYKKNTEFLLPEKKQQEILNRLKNELKDVSISRKQVSWGIEFPLNKEFTVFVWLEALMDYLSTIGFGTEKFDRYWPADIHLIGKDIQWFHTVIWNSVLLSLELPLPKTVFVHGFINTDSGEKMSKSKGNVIDPLKLAEEYEIDSLRYFLLREIPFGADGNFSEKKLIDRHNNELANDLGNLVNRVLSLIEKNCDGKIPEGKTDKELKKRFDKNKIFEHMDKYELNLALNEIMMFVKECNKYVNETEPWKKEGKELNGILYSLADAIRIIAILINPFIPETSAKIFKQLGVKEQTLKECEFNLIKAGTKTEKKEVLFKKI